MDEPGDYVEAQDGSDDGFSVPTNEKIIALCQDPSSVRVGGCGHVVQVSPRAVVKFGLGCTRQEAEGLRVAYDLVNPQIARVPKFLKHFQHDGTGYTVMELLRGRSLTPDEDLNVMQKVVQLIKSLRLIKGTLGPLGGGISTGLLWESDRPNFKGRGDLLQNWINSRIFEKQPRIVLESCEFTLCHLDLTPRNLLLLDDGSLGVVDWDFAGFYPSSFELGSLTIMHSDYKYARRILEMLGPLPQKEEAQIRSLHYAVFNADAYYFRPTEISNRNFHSFGSSRLDK